MTPNSSTLAWKIPWTVQDWITFVIPGLYRNSPGQNTGVGSLSVLQGIFPTQGLNPGLLHCRQVLYQPSHKGSPKILEWVAYSFSSRSSQPRNRTGVSCITSRFFTNWAMKERQLKSIELLKGFSIAFSPGMWFFPYSNTDGKHYEVLHNAFNKGPLE